MGSVACVYLALERRMVMVMSMGVGAKMSDLFRSKVTMLAIILSISLW